MFNLNIPPSSLLGIDGSGLCSTPKTPEIVNSLIAMTNPMDNYTYSALNTSTSTPGSAVSVRNLNSNFNAQAISQDSSHSSSSVSPLDSPAGTNTTPSVQQTCSQLIKAGLKLSIQSKRKLSTCESSSGSDQPNSKCSRRDEDCEETTDDDGENKSIIKGLTPEDEDRRRRRRERNKIAATKCRMKKRERTQNLIKESEQLDNQNIDLKNQVRALELERRKLLEMLQAHSLNCVHHGGYNLPAKLMQSPAFKYLSELELDTGNVSIACSSSSCTSSGTSKVQKLQVDGSQSMPTQRTAIPPMSTIKFSRSNDFKATIAANTVNIDNAVAITQSLHPLPSQPSSLHQQLPNGYCKPSPTPQELGYLNSPSQESICLPSLQPPQPSHTPITESETTSTLNNQLADYIPNCENNLGVGLSQTSTATTTNSNVLLGGVPSPLSAITTSTSATEFVKNELVDSHSPYTTAQSAERFLFESNCDSYVDIKHAVSVHPGSHNTSSSPSLANNSNLLDFHSTLMGNCSSNGLVSFHDQISIKNDYLHEADLLALADAGEFVDLDTGVAAAFITNGGCLA